MSWISGWWKGEKKEVQKVENVPELGDDDKNIKNLVESFRSDKTTYTGTLYFKPMIGLDCFKDYIKVDSDGKKYIEYAGDYEISYVDFGGGKLNLFFNKITIKENSNSIELDYLKDINFIRFSYIDEQFYNYHKADTSKSNITQITVVLQLINMDPESETIPALASVNDVPEVQITGTYTSAVLTNFKNFDKDEDDGVSMCKTNVVLNGSLNSFYNAELTKMLPQNFGSGTTEWTMTSVNDVVKTGVNDENNAEIIIGFENESTLDLSVITNPILTSTYWSNFYVRNVTMTSETSSALPFYYWDVNTLRNSIVDYVISKIEETTSGNFQVLTIYLYSQNGNDFLDKYVVNGEFQFDVTSTNLNSDVQRLISTQFQRCLIVVEQMIREEDGNEFEIRCCSKEVSGANVICSSGTASCGVIPDYKITNLCCINTSDLDLKSELPEAEITLLTQQNAEFTYDNLYLTNLTKEGATNTNLLLEGDITSLYQYLPLKRSEYPEGYPKYLKDVDTINDSPVPNEYLDANISMCLIDIEDANDINISKFGTTKDGEFVQNVFVSLITAYRSDTIIDKLTNSGLKSRNEAVSHGETLGDSEVEYADTQYRFGNPNLVQSVTPSGEDEYSAIRLNFANQYDSGFLDNELVEDGSDWNLIIDLNNKPTDPNDPESPSTSDQFRSMIDSYNSLLLFVQRMETIKDLYFFKSTKTIKNVKVYYYNANGEYVSDPWTLVKTSENFKTKVSEMYWAHVQSIETKNYLLPDGNYFTDENKIKVWKRYLNFINIIDNLYTTSEAIDRNSTDSDPKEIRAQKINLFVNGTIPAWIFKEVLPLTVEVGTKTHFRFIKSDGTVYLSNEHGIDDLQIIGINDKPNMKNILFPSIGMDVYTGSFIDLSNISGGTAVANKDVFDRMSIGSNKVFFVNKVTLLERFKGKKYMEGVFQYYEGEPTEAKNCVYNAEDPESGSITYADDWALKLPECYEGCEINQNDTSQLIMRFGTYEQLSPDACLLKNVIEEDDLYLDVSTSRIDVSNITKIKLILKEIKYFISEEGVPDEEFGFFADKQSLNVIYILFNDNGFVGTKGFNYEDLSDSDFIDEITTNYIIGGVNRLENSTRMVEPLKNVFMIYDGMRCIALKYRINCESNLFTYGYRITNVFEENNFYGINLLVSGEIPSWIMKYMPLPIKLNYVTYDSNYGWIFELSEDKTNINHSIDSVNALPTPDGDVGIDNVN